MTTPLGAFELRAFEEGWEDQSDSVDLLVSTFGGTVHAVSRRGEFLIVVNEEPLFEIAKKANPDLTQDLIGPSRSFMVFVNADERDLYCLGRGWRRLQHDEAGELPRTVAHSLAESTPIRLQAVDALAGTSFAWTAWNSDVLIAAGDSSEYGRLRSDDRVTSLANQQQLDLGNEERLMFSHKELSRMKRGRTSLSVLLADKFGRHLDFRVVDTANIETATGVALLAGRGALGTKPALTAPGGGHRSP